ncbi:MAG: hypothetical protein ACREFI_14915, partial [Stellaceae bacterium]
RGHSFGLELPKNSARAAEHSRERRAELLAIGDRRGRRQDGVQITLERLELQYGTGIPFFSGRCQSIDIFLSRAAAVDKHGELLERN